MEEYLDIGWSTKVIQKVVRKVRMDYIWEVSIVKTCLRMMIELWEIRDEEVYGKNESTKQKKRKAKAAISV